ncbi:cytochrome b [Marinomonas transparens]|uniref:Cytochrome b n=1 Tax=Marinomonas transparens TaxID=2795388 RepID=A0A934JPM1_9GAMM|nr:cytochrome b [Marinomonas transparens]MBJ7537453.1 cytochrome b [Marinomonas transparens]
MSNSTKPYSSLQIALHWAVAALIILNYFVSEGMGHAFHQHLDNSNDGYGLVSSIHVYVGLTIIALVIIRLIVRVVSKTPAPSKTNYAMLDRVSKGMHHLLYLLMFLVPVFGAGAWFFGIHILGDVHEITMNLMMLLVLIHASAALFHQYILKDDTLLKMFGRK